MNRVIIILIVLVSVLTVTLGFGIALSHEKIWDKSFDEVIANLNAEHNTDEATGTIRENATAGGSHSSNLISESINLVTEEIRMAANSIKSPTSISVIIGGDVMFDRHIRKIAMNKGYNYPLRNIASFLKSADIVAVNLEGPITTNDSKSLLKTGSTTAELSFTFDPETASALNDAGINIVSLANNHTDNFGYDGYKETLPYLDKVGIQYFGNPWNNEPVERVTTDKGIDVAFIGYNSFQGGFDNVLGAVQKASADGNFVIVMPHWGEEYVTVPTEQMRERARALVASGANVIVGSHPHVIIGHEFIGHVPVFWSLGNLLFDQYFSPEVMKGEIVKFVLSRDGNKVIINSIEVYETSIASKDGVTIKTNQTIVKVVDF